MRIAITGAAGRIGRLTTQLCLDQGHSVVAIDRPGDEVLQHDEVTAVELDVTDWAAYRQAIADTDALIHLAAYASPTGRPDYRTHDNNVLGSYHALSAAQDAGLSRVCQASSINAIGAGYSRRARFDYFPVDEEHPTYNEDAYSLSKWIAEAQADSFARRYEAMTIASLRFHWVVPDRAKALIDPEDARNQLWGYTSHAAAARACLLGVTADFTGHEAFFVVAPDVASDVPSVELAARYYPEVPIVGDLSGQRGFFDCGKAGRLLGWGHEDPVGHD